MKFVVQTAPKYKLNISPLQKSVDGQASVKTMLTQRTLVSSQVLRISY